MIQDLFPSYIDGLTSEVTNGILREHIKECISCKETLEQMQNYGVEPIKFEER